MQKLWNIGEKILPDALDKIRVAEVEVCDKCFGSGMEVVPGKGARPCACSRPNFRQKFIEKIPNKITKFGVPELNKLAPRNDLHPDKEIAAFICKKQQSLLSSIKQNPFANYYLAGKNGCGKTTIAYAILLNAFDNGRRIVAITLSELLKQIQSYEMSNGEEKLRNRPAILPEHLAQSKDKFSILLDEIGLAKVSDYRTEIFFNLLNQLQNYGHQLIVTSNHDAKSLCEKWGKDDEILGDTIARRLSEKALGWNCFWE